MNTSINNRYAKLKRCTEFEFNGQTVWVEHDENGLVNVCDSAALALTDNYFVVNRSELKPVFKGRNGIAAKPQTAEQRAHRNDLDTFFISLEESIPFDCQNCRKPLYAVNRKFKRGVCAHILPKAEFESVAMNPLNILFLGWDLIGVCNCHDAWDRQGREHRSKMKCYDQAIRQFELFKHELTPHELVKAYDYLNIK